MYNTKKGIDLLVDIILLMSMVRVQARAVE